MSTEDIYKTDQIYASALKRLRESNDVSDEDKASILSLLDHMTTKGIGRLRAIKYVNHLIVLARMAGKPLAELGKPEVESLVSRINTSDYRDSTRRDYKIILKCYFQWMRGLDEDEHQYPDEVRWIKTGQKSRRLLPEELVTPDEVMTLVGAAETPRDRAFKSHRSHHSSV